jgi:hypothetical protein
MRRVWRIGFSKLGSRSSDGRSCRPEIRFPPSEREPDEVLVVEKEREVAGASERGWRRRRRRREMPPPEPESVPTDAMANGEYTREMVVSRGERS